MKNSTVLMSSLRLLFVTLLFCATMDTVSSSVRRRLHRAKADRVPDHYYVHFRRDTTLAEGKELVDIMNQLDKDIFRPNFTAMIQGVVTKTGHGFAAKLSEDALKYVSQMLEQGITIQCRRRDQWLNCMKVCINKCV